MSHQKQFLGIIFLAISILPKKYAAMHILVKIIQHLVYLPSYSISLSSISIVMCNL